MQYKITYSGEIISTNKFYSSGHWTMRSAFKNKFVKIFSTLLLEAKVKPFESFDLRLVYNSRHDLDNLSMMCKVFTDSLKGKYVKDDTPKYFKSLHISHDNTLAKNTIDFYIDAN